MSDKGKTQLTYIFTATPELVKEGDRLFASHAQWMEETHHKGGKRALLRYSVVKGPELSNPLDPSSPPTANICFVLLEVYDTPEALGDHWTQGVENWKDLRAFVKWASAVQVTVLHGSPVVHSLW